MRALSKGKAAQFFKKAQVKQDLQQITNSLQAKLISASIGISQQEIAQFKWFFDQIAKFKLPSNYQKVLNQKKNQLVYRQKSTKQQTTIHPLLNIIKNFFYDNHKSNQSTFTFQKKKQKLLPYVEQKMMKNCISLNSKRRQVEKVNLQKDQNGKNVLSKMARVKPDIKSLISARSYMLKMLVQKVYTSKQIWGKGKRAKALAGILNQKRKFIQDQEEQENKNSYDLDTYQNIFVEASKFYQQEYGNLTRIPTSILNSEQYKRSTPQNVLRNMFMLNISKNQIQFYWFARLMDCLTIPHNWSKIQNSSYESYLYEPLKLTFDLHPCYIYIILQMNKFKDYFNTLSNQQKSQFYKDKQMTFYDFFQRKYKVDIYGLALKEQLKNQQKQNDENKLTNMERNANDWMIVQAIINSSIKSAQYPLIAKFCQFWKSKYFPEQQYIPTISPFGQITWSSTVNYSSIEYCPYKQILTNKILAQSSRMPKIQLQDFKSQYRRDLKIQGDDISVKKNSHSSRQLIQTSRQRQRFLSHYLDHINQPALTPYFINNYSQKDYFDQIFICPFSLDEGIQSMNFGNQEDGLSEQKQVPIWMQKVRAKKQEAKIKNMANTNSNFQDLKQYLSRYAIETTLKYEPNRIQDVQQMLRNITNFQDLKIFTQKITNVDERQERIRKANQKLEVKPADDDIFGSQQSNFAPSEVESQSQQPQSQQQQSQSQQQNAEVTQVKQIDESQSSQEEKQQQVPIQQPQQEQEKVEQVKPRQQYSFLKQMKRNKVYQKSPFFDQIDNQNLESMLKKKAKQTLKKYKYSPSYMKSKIKNKINSHVNNDKHQINAKINTKKDQQIKNIKRNLVITNMKYTSLPYNNNKQLMKIPYKNKLNEKNIKNIKKIQQCNNQSEYNIIDNSDLLNNYDSYMEDYENQQLINHIKSLPKKEQVKQEQSSEDENPEILVKPKQKQVIIFLQPIKRTKPDISSDPYLRHIDTVDSESQLNMFKSTFLNKGQINKGQIQNNLTKLKFRSKSTNNILKTIQISRKSSQKKQKQIKSIQMQSKSSLNKFESLKLITKKKLLEDTKQSTIFQSNQSFNRVCLGHTASNFLSTQPLKRKSQLVVLQARKSLAHKGRGIQTYISKKY